MSTSKSTSSPYDPVAELAKATNTETIYKNLISIRSKVIKTDEGIRKLIKNGGLKLLLLYISKPNIKVIDISLSILGNCCMNADVRKEILKLNGIAPIVTILKGLETESIQNRACRTLANLALDREIAKAIHKEEAVPVVVSFLNGTRDHLCQQTAFRALRLFADTPKHRDEVIRHEGLRTIVEQLDTDDEEVLKSALKATTHLTQNCTHACAKQMFMGQHIQSLVKLASHKNDNIRQPAVCTLVNLAHEQSIRSVLGNEGTMTVFIKETNLYVETPEKSCGKSPIFALCLSCVEPGNRKRISENKGLDALLAVLTNENPSFLQEKIVEAILYFMYDPDCLTQFMEKGLIPILIQKLSQYIALEKLEHSFDWQFRQRELPPKEEKSENDLDKATEKSKTKSKNKLNPFFGRNLKQKASHLSFEPFESHYRFYDHECDEHPFAYRFCMPDMWPHWQNTATCSHHDNTPKKYTPEWIIPEPSPHLCKEDHLCMFRRHRSPRSMSPMSISPPISPNRLCYSPICAEFSEEEDEAATKNESSPMKENLADDENWRKICVDQDLYNVQEVLANDVEKLAEKMSSQDPNLQLVNISKRFSDPEGNVAKPPINNILILLSRFSQIDKPSIALATTSCVTTLLDAMVMIHKPCSQVTRMLSTVAGQVLFLESLILMHFPEQLTNLLDYEDWQYCNSCELFRTFAREAVNKMIIQAVSPFGQGVVEHLIAAGNKDDKTSAVLMVPYLYHQETKLVSKFYLEKGGIEVMMSILQDPSDKNFNVAVRSCLKLCNIFPVYAPQFRLRSDMRHEDWGAREPGRIFCFYESDEQPKDITFVLDSGETVKANKAVLCKNCDVFDAMLLGGFKEADSNTVAFGEAGGAALDYVIHFLHGCDYAYMSVLFSDDFSSIRSNCPLYNAKVDDLLEVFFLSDRLLLKDLQVLANSELMKLASRDKAGEKIFEVAAMYNEGELAKNLIQKMVSCSVSLDVSLVFLKNILNTKENKEVVLRLEELIRYKFKTAPVAAAKPERSSWSRKY